VRQLRKACLFPDDIDVARNRLSQDWKRIGEFIVRPAEDVVPGGKGARGPPAPQGRGG
jgi:hypothetical protein